MTKVHGWCRKVKINPSMCTKLKVLTLNDIYMCKDIVKRYVR